MNQRHNRVNVIVRGVQLFSANGYHATGIDEICNYTGLTKGAFYHLFKSKLGFFEECLEVYSLGNINFIEDQFHESQDLNAINRLLTFVNRLFEIQARRQYAGCLVFNSISELGLSDPDLRHLLDNYYEEFVSTIEPIIKECQIEGSITTEFEAIHLAEMLNTFINGAITRIKGSSESEYSFSIQLVKDFIERLRPASDI